MRHHDGNRKGQSSPPAVLRTSAYLVGVPPYKAESLGRVKGQLWFHIQKICEYLEYAAAVYLRREGDECQLLRLSRFKDHGGLCN